MTIKLLLRVLIILCVFLCSKTDVFAQFQEPEDDESQVSINNEKPSNDSLSEGDLWVFLPEDIKNHQEIDVLIETELTQVVDLNDSKKIHLEKELAQSKEKQNQAKLEEEEAKNALKSASSTLLRNYAAEKIKLSAYRSNLAKHNQEWLQRIQSLLTEYTVLEKKLLKLEDASFSLGQLTNEELTQVFQQSQVLWRTILDDGTGVYKLATKILKVEEVPMLPVALLSKVEPEDRVSFELLHQKTEKERTEFIASQSQSFAEKFEEYYANFAKSAGLRSAFLAQAQLRSISVFESNSSLSADLFREAYAIPFRIFGVVFLRLFHVKNGLSSGFWEFLQTLFSLFWLFFWFLIPLTLRFSNKYISKYLEQYRRFLLYHSSGNISQRLRRASLLKQLTPYIPWAIYCLLLYFIYNQLEGAGFDEARVILPLIIYFTLYRMFRLVMRDSLGMMREFLNLNAAEHQEKIRITSRNLGLFFFVIVCILYISKSAVDEGYLYEILKSVMKYLGYLLMAREAFKWRQEVADTSKSLLHKSLAIPLSKACLSVLGFFVCLPTIFIILITIVLRAIVRFLSTFEVIKRLLAKLYRRQIESLGEKLDEQRIVVPEEYKSLFTARIDIAEKFVIEANQSVFEQMRQEIESWTLGKEADPALLLFGEKGLGKSLMLRRLEKSSFDCDVIKISIPAKLTKKESLYAFLSSCFGFENPALFIENLHELNATSERKTLILMDNAENLFIGKMGGFEAVKAFVDILNQNNKELFWCSTFNSYAWTYLQGVLGGSQYLGTELSLSPWSDKSIRALIETRQSDNDYDVSYEKIIRVTGQGGNNLQGSSFYAQEQYFRMLWEQSNGNPRIALYLWIKSVSLKNEDNTKKLLVHLPEKPRGSQLSKLSELSWFILAAIAKHENATQSELQESTHIPLSEILHLLKIGVEQRILFHGDGDRYRINFLYHFEVIKHLKAKNLIFGRD